MKLFDLIYSHAVGAKLLQIYGGVYLQLSAQALMILDSACCTVLASSLYLMRVVHILCSISRLKINSSSYVPFFAFHANACGIFLEDNLLSIWRKNWQERWKPTFDIRGIIFAAVYFHFKGFQPISRFWVNSLERKKSTVRLLPNSTRSSLIPISSYIFILVH